MRRHVTVEEEGEEGLMGGRRAGGTPGESELAVRCSLDVNRLHEYVENVEMWMLSCAW